MLGVLLLCKLSTMRNLRAETRSPLARGRQAGSSAGAREGFGEGFGEGSGEGDGLEERWM